MTERPRVSVVMPLFNAAPYVVAAVESILNQTFGDFELVVVDDASTDGGAELVEGLADRRVRVLRQRLNGGISVSLNAGIAATTGDLIARMDADDVSWPNRLERQVAFLDAHAEVGIVGCTPMLLTADGQQIRPFPVLARDEELRRMLPLQGPFCHGAVMFRRAVFDLAGPYRRDEQPAEDFALWLRMANVTHLANLPEVLYGLRVTNTSVSARSRNAQLDRRDQVRARARTLLGPTVLRLGQLKDERRRYREMEAPEGPMLDSRYASQHQELACLDAVERGLRAWRNVLIALALGPVSARTPIRMLRCWQAERARRRSRSRSIPSP